MISMMMMVGGVMLMTPRARKVPGLGDEAAIIGYVLREGNPAPARTSKNFLRIVK